MNSNSLEVHPGDLAAVRRILARHVPEYDVYAFGSRVSGKPRRTSDLDLVVMTRKRLEALRRVDLKEAFSESDLPFKVDVVDWADIQKNFKKLILKKRFKIQSGKKTNV